MITEEKLKNKNLGFFANLYAKFKSIPIIANIYKHWYFYVGIIGLVLAYVFMKFLADLLGGFQNAYWAVGIIASIIFGLWLYNIKAFSIFMKFIFKNWYWFFLGFILVSVGLYAIAGSEFNSFLMTVRQKTFNIFVLLPIIGAISYFKFNHSSTSWKQRIAKFIGALVLWGGFAGYTINDGDRFIAQYFKYQELSSSIVKVDRALTPTVRIYPHQVYATALDEEIGDNNLFTSPDFVWRDKKLMASASYTPMERWQKFKEAKMTNVVYYPATESSIIKNAIYENVEFDVAENLFGSREIYMYAIKSLHLNYFNAFPTNIQVLPNNEGKNVSVVSIAYWDGYLFPTLEFYGVLIVESGEKLTYDKRAIYGSSNIIKKDDIRTNPEFSYLIGQNLTSKISTKFAAESYKFKNGFFAAMGTFHDDDLVLTDMNGNDNDFPIVTPYKMQVELNDKSIKLFDEKLYDYYELKPYKEKSENASHYLYFSSDGLGDSYIKNLSGYITSNKTVAKVSATQDGLTKDKYAFIEPRQYNKPGLPDLQLVSRVFLYKGKPDTSGIKSFLIQPYGPKESIEVPTDKPETWEKLAKEKFN